MTDEADATAGLRGIVEAIRSEDCPELDPLLVDQVLDAQFRFAEDRAEAAKVTDQIVNAWVAMQQSKRSDA